jgi:hypothetical protein
VPVADVGPFLEQYLLISLGFPVRSLSVRDRVRISASRLGQSGRLRGRFRDSLRVDLEAFRGCFDCLVLVDHQQHNVAVVERSQYRIRMLDASVGH